MIRTRTVAVVVSAGLLFAARAAAEDFFAEANPATVTAVEKPAGPPPDHGVQIGLRSGFGLPFGKPYDADVSLKGDFKGVIPIWVDAGYRFNPAMYLGAYGMFGYGLMNTGNNVCGADGVSCSGYNVRVGINGQYHFLPKGSVDPWFGVGFGYEWLHNQASGPGGSISQTFRGVELLGLQIGTDFEVDQNIKLGPFIGYSIGQFGYGKQTYDTAQLKGTSNLGISNMALHEWLVFGVRVVLNI